MFFYSFFFRKASSTFALFFTNVLLLRLLTFLWVHCLNLVFSHKGLECVTPINWCNWNDYLSRFYVLLILWFTLILLQNVLRVLCKSYTAFCCSWRKTNRAATNAVECFCLSAILRRNKNSPSASFGARSCLPWTATATPTHSSRCECSCSLTMFQFPLYLLISTIFWIFVETFCLRKTRSPSSRLKWRRRLWIQSLTRQDSGWFDSEYLFTFNF